MNSLQPPRDHLFISYAIEQSVLARWLTLRLTSEGYRVWCDQFKLLGGESFPHDIDDAIRRETFRVIALISNESLKKPNPTKERTLALNLSRDRNESFLIPIITDATKPVDLNWMLADLTYISFQSSWADGLARLLKNLRVSNAPISLDKGREVAASAYIVDSTIVDRSEKIFSNLFQIDHIPAALSQYSVYPPLDEVSTIALQEHWPVYVANASHILAFERPPATITAEHKFEFESAVSWRDSKKISNIPSENIAKSILKKSLYVHCLRRGLKRHLEIKCVYFPRGVILNDRLKFRDQNDRANWFLVSGERTKMRSKYRYFLCPTFRIRSDIGDAWFIQIGIRLLITDEFNVILPKASAFSRRKDICSNWWNSEWLKRVLGIMQYLSEGQDTLQIGQYSREQIEVSTHPYFLRAEIGIDEKRLAMLKEEDAKVLMSSSLEEDGD